MNRSLAAPFGSVAMSTRLGVGHMEGRVHTGIQVCYCVDGIIRDAAQLADDLRHCRRHLDEGWMEVLHLNQAPITLVTCDQAPMISLSRNAPIFEKNDLVRV